MSISFSNKVVSDHTVTMNNQELNSAEVIPDAH